MPLIDVIIPVYNSRQYISGLLECLEGQTMRDFCAIFVDDGSTDDSYALLQEGLGHAGFAHKLIHQENKGLSGARNTGIRHSDAQWITFLDSDDGLDPHYFEFLHKGVSKNDTPVGICGYQRIAVREDAIAVSEDAFSCRVISAKACLERYYTKWFGAWALILQRQWLADSGILFDEECTYLEDVPFITQIIVNAGCVSVIQNDLYLYYQRPGSLMRTPQIEKYLVALNGFHRMYDRVSGISNDAASAFCSMGRARYYLATLHRAAVLMPYRAYRAVCDAVPMKECRGQFKHLPIKLRASAWLYLASRALFYGAMRALAAD